MGAGERRTKIAIQQKTIAHDTYNTKIETWVTWALVNAKKITTGGKEFYAAQRLNAETSAVYEVPYNRVINSQMRIKDGNQIYEILSVNDVDGKHKDLLISCKSEVL